MIGPAKNKITKVPIPIGPPSINPMRKPIASDRVLALAIERLNHS